MFKISQKRTESPNFATTHLYFVRSGYIELPIAAGTFSGADYFSDYWSKAATSMRWDGAAVPSAYNFDTRGDIVYPTVGPSNRWFGFSLRCLAVRMSPQKA